MDQHQREGYRGTGPGAITPDGCAVELYSRLPIGEEPQIIAGAVPAGATILELGSGVGRMTHPLIERGFTVTAVDESPQMLERVRGARVVCSSIESLDLKETFGVVLLASFLVHAAEPGVGAALLETCRRHVSADGCVLIQREGADYHENVPRERKNGDGVVRVLSSEPVGPGVRSVRVENVYPDATWTHTFAVRPLTTEQFEQALTRAGLALDRYLTEDGTWARAIPV
jgi:SAM-dependent methyltransferase